MYDTYINEVNERELVIRQVMNLLVENGYDSYDAYIEAEKQVGDYRQLIPTGDTDQSLMFS
jgi:hypothetical protein